MSDYPSQHPSMYPAREQTGPHPRAAASSPVHDSGPHPVLVATRNEGVFTVNTRTLVLIAFALLGGGAGSTGIQLISGSPTEVREELKDMNKQLNEISASIIKLTAEMKESGNANVRLNTLIADHEARIRKLEEKMKR